MKYIFLISFSLCKIIYEKEVAYLWSYLEYAVGYVGGVLNKFLVARGRCWPTWCPPGKASPNKPFGYGAADLREEKLNYNSLLSKINSKYDIYKQTSSILLFFWIITNVM